MEEPQRRILWSVTEVEGEDGRYRELRYGRDLGVKRKKDEVMRRKSSRGGASVAASEGKAQWSC